MRDGRRLREIHDRLESLQDHSKSIQTQIEALEKERDQLDGYYYPGDRFRRLSLIHI